MERSPWPYLLAKPLCQVLVAVGPWQPWWAMIFLGPMAIIMQLKYTKSTDHHCRSCVYLCAAAAAAAKSLRSCLTLRDPVDGSPPGSPVPRILQARTLEWVAISFSNAWKWKVKVKSLSRVWLFTTPWTAAHQAPPSMGFSSKSTGVGCHCLLCKIS